MQSGQPSEFRQKLGEALEAYWEITREIDEVAARIRKAEEHRTNVSDHIFDKVTSEYHDEQERLRNQREPLAARVAECRGQLQDELKRVEETLRGLEDRANEVEFRCTVGEFSRDEYDQRLSELRPEIDSARAEQAEVNELLQRCDLDRRQNDRDPAAGGRRADDPAETPNPVATPDPAPRTDVYSTPPTVEPHAPQSHTSQPHAPQPHAPAPQSSAPQSEATPQPVATASDLPNAFEDLKGWADTVDLQEKAQTEDPLAALADPDTRGESASGGVPASFVTVRSNGLEKRVPLLPMTMSIGREHDNNIEIKDPEVARYHARISYSGGRHVLEDLASSTGTWLNGERTQLSAINDGDVVKVGSTELEIKIG